MKDLEGSKHFSNTRIFISDVFFESYYSYYIFWNDGRCFYSDGRTIDEINLDDILNDKRGTAAYYTVSNDSLCTERYTDGVFLYEYFTLTENKLSQIGEKRRKPFRKLMYNVEMYPNFWLEERYTRPGTDSIYFNSDYVALWQPFW